MALQIQNPGDISQRLGPPQYSEFLKDLAKKDLNFAQYVHDKLADLVKLAKEVRQIFFIYFLLEIIFFLFLAVQTEKSIFLI